MIAKFHDVTLDLAGKNFDPKTYNLWVSNLLRTLTNNDESKLAELQKRYKGEVKLQDRLAALMGNSFECESFNDLVVCHGDVHAQNFGLVDGNVNIFDFECVFAGHW